MAKGDGSSLKKKVEGEFEEDTLNVGKLVKTLIQSFLKSDSNYGAITDIKTDINNIYNTVRDYIKEEKVDVYAIKMDDRILLSKTNVDFDDIYQVIKERSELKVKEDVIEIWDDSEEKILHLIILPVKKHFPIEYANFREKENIMEKISLMTWQIS
jgi:hypothetical protein